MTCITSKLVRQGALNIFTILNYVTHLTSFKQIGSSIEDTQTNQSLLLCGRHDKSDGLVMCLSIKDTICLKLIRYFCFCFVSTKTSFGFCSCSDILQLTFAEKKTNLARKCKFLSPQDSYRGDIDFKENIYTISKTLWKGLNVNWHVLKM